MTRQKDQQLKPLLTLLEEVLERLRVPCKYEHFTKTNGDGGMCRVEGQALIILNRNLNTAHRIRAIVEILESLNHEHEYLPPIVREILDAHRLDSEHGVGVRKGQLDRVLRYRAT